MDRTITTAAGIAVVAALTALAVTGCASSASSGASSPTASAASPASSPADSAVALELRRVTVRAPRLASLASPLGIPAASRLA